MRHAKPRLNGSVAPGWPCRRTTVFPGSSSSLSSMRCWRMYTPWLSRRPSTAKRTSRVRPHRRSRNRGTEDGGESGVKWTSGGTERPFATEPQADLDPVEEGFPEVQLLRDMLGARRGVTVHRPKRCKSPIHSRGHAAANGWSWPDFWGSLASASPGWRASGCRRGPSSSPPPRRRGHSRTALCIPLAIIYSTL